MALVIFIAEVLLCKPTTLTMLSILTREEVPLNLVQLTAESTCYSAVADLSLCQGAKMPGAALLVGEQ